MSLLLSIVSAVLSFIALYLSYKAYSIAKLTQIYNQANTNIEGYYIEDTQQLEDSEPITEGEPIHIDLDESLEYWREIDSSRSRF